MNLPAALILLLATGITSAQAATLTFSPDQVGDVFCIGTLADDMSQIEAGLLTPALVEAITIAETRNSEFESQHPGDKPPLGDGLPWRSYPDFADSCTVGAVTLTDDATAASVAINYTFNADPSANYTDTLQLKQTTGTDRFYQLDDIDQIDGQRFTTTLAAAFSDQDK
ncbi:MAG: hypothetical protein JWR51_2141 [Devosia sp.]|uniref:hypothetical protein n=1 Tax=Devosia sp. TaxID=1871048 RepID=UPI002632D965|nr:hypothetical protein [Devosia sp.]MDB5529038.1 hypothetical protein [Devosia sp.]